MTPEQLSSNDALTLEIGRIARRDAEMEAQAKDLWKSMAGRYAAPAVPRGMGDVFAGCLAMLPGARLPGDLESHAEEAIKSARTDHDRRHTLVHERWVAWGDLGWLRERDFLSIEAVTHWTLKDFQDGRDALSRSVVRLFATKALCGAVGTSGGSVTTLNRPAWEAMLRGEFTVNAYGFPKLNDASLALP